MSIGKDGTGIGIFWQFKTLESLFSLFFMAVFTGIEMYNFTVLVTTGQLCGFARLDGFGRYRIDVLLSIYEIGGVVAVRTYAEVVAGGGSL
jgi:hypothetical protein